MIRLATLSWQCSRRWIRRPVVDSTRRVFSSPSDPTNHFVLKPVWETIQDEKPPPPDKIIETELGEGSARYKTNCVVCHEYYASRHDMILHSLNDEPCTSFIGAALKEKYRDELKRQHEKKLRRRKMDSVRVSKRKKNRQRRMTALGKRGDPIRARNKKPKKFDFQDLFKPDPPPTTGS